MNLARDTDDRYVPKDFNKIKVGLQTLEDAVVSYSDLQKTNARLGTKSNVLRAIEQGDVQ